MNSSRNVRHPHGSVHAFTIVELLTVLTVIGVLLAVVISGVGRIKHFAKRTKCMNNLRQLAAADIGHFADYGEFPLVEGLVPSTITAERLAGLAKYTKMQIPIGPPARWPKRMAQPDWYMCPMARDSGYAEGLTMGGGVYTGYAYVGGIDESRMILSGMASLANPEHSAHRKNLRRGVLWCDLLTEFHSADDRRFECFHSERGKRYPDFRFPEHEIEGIHRAWSDGSVEWVPLDRLQLAQPQSQSRQIRHFLGNFYY